MSQLTQLIEQARNRRGINDLFKTHVDSLTFTQSHESKGETTLADQLDELEQLLFKKNKMCTEHSETLLQNLEELLEVL